MSWWGSHEVKYFFWLRPVSFHCHLQENVPLGVEGAVGLEKVRLDIIS